MTLTTAFIAALIAVESGGDDRAVGDRGNSFGCLQISRTLLRDFHRLTGEKVRPEQCFDRFTSISICAAYLAHYCTVERLGHEPTLEDAARIWVGGPDGWRKDATLPYWAKVQKHLYPGTRAAHLNNQTPRENVLWTPGTQTKNPRRD